MKKIIGCMIVLVLLALSGLASAGERAGALSASPFIGGYQFDEDQPLRRNRLVYGLRLGYDWTDSLETELVADYVRAESLSTSKTDISAWSYRLDMLYNFMPRTAVVPYLAAGVGGITIEYPKSFGGDLSEPTANIGAGVKFFITDSVALRLDGRHIWDFSNDNFRHEAYSNWEYSAGLSFLFGGAKPAAAVQPAAEPAAETPAAEPPLEPVPAAEPTPGHYKYCVTLNIQFDIDRAEIRPQFRDQVARVGDFMKKYPTTTAVIEGHTDNTGSPENNMKLSQQRAENVVSYLVDKFGIDRSRLSAKGYGSTRRISYNNTPEGRQQNRRINAVIDCVVK